MPFIAMIFLSIERAVAGVQQRPHRIEQRRAGRRVARNGDRSKLRVGRRRDLCRLTMASRAMARQVLDEIVLMRAVVRPCVA